MKTIREWLSEGLSVEHYKLISKYNPSRDWDTYKVQSLKGALIDSLPWSHTEEGYDFWESVCKDIHNDCYIKHSNNIFLKI